MEGQNILTVRGPKATLDEIEQSGANVECDEMYAGMFGKENCKTLERTDNCLLMIYAFRDISMNAYLFKLLKQYKDCWFKNEFETDSGGAGVWIGRYIHGKVDTQEVSWKELTVKEIAHDKNYNS